MGSKRDVAVRALAREIIEAVVDRHNDEETPFKNIAVRDLPPDLLEDALCNAIPVLKIIVEGSHEIVLALGKSLTGLRSAQEHYDRLASSLRSAGLEASQREYEPVATAEPIIEAAVEDLALYSRLPIQTSCSRGRRPHETKRWLIRIIRHLGASNLLIQRVLLNAGYQEHEVTEKRIGALILEMKREGNIFPERPVGRPAKHPSK